MTTGIPANQGRATGRQSSGTRASARGRLRPAIGSLVALALLPTALPASASNAGGGDINQRWVRHGFAEAWALGAADTDGDGSDEVVYGGRGVALVDDRTLATGQPRWNFKWDDDPTNVLTGGDNMWTTGLEMVDATGDGIRDALLTTSDSAAYLLDGVTGNKVWRAPTDGGLSNGFALLDADADDVPDLLPTGSRTVLSGRTGDELWEAPVPRNARFAGSGYFDGDDKRDVVITINAPGAGTNPNTIVPALTATVVFVVSSKGELLYDFEPYNGIESIAAADIDGDGVDETVLGTFNGFVHVIGPGGIRWSAALGPAAVTALEVLDPDGDGRDEIIAGTGSGALNEPRLYEVVAFGAEGAQRWRHVVPDPIETMQLGQLDGDDAKELLVGGGTTGSAPVGSAVALETDLVAPTREMWRVDTAQRVDDFAILDGSGGRRVAIGSADALLRIVDARDGSARAAWTAGGYTETVLATDLDADGRDETVTGGGGGHVIVSDANGEEVWSTKVAGGNKMSVFQVAAGDVNEDGRQEVAAAAEIFDRDDAGQISMFSRDGDELWTRALVGLGQDVKFADLDNDGDEDVVVAEGGAALGDPCAIGGYDGETGDQLWRVDLPTCIVIHTDVADVDRDGLSEVGFGTQVLFGTPQVGLVRADGTLAWHLEPPQASAWVDVAPGRFVHGGFADQARGHLTDRDIHTGDIRWQAFLPGDRNNGGSANRFGLLVPDQNEDGVGDIVTSSDSREVLLVDGASGATIWATRTQASEVPVTQAHQSGPLAYVSGAAVDPVIFAAQYATGRQLSKTFALSLAGEIVGVFGMEGDAHAASPATFAPQLVGAVVGAGLGTYAYQVVAPQGSSQIATSLTLTVAGTGVRRVLEVSLTSMEDRTPVAGRTIELSADGEMIGSILTDTNGVGQLTAPPRYRGGEHLFEAIFSGDETFGPATATASS